ncbi:MAG: restriction endonuclease subunit S [Planctomycetia bacterium]|nr:MAG: restriction endonuclease subunit S [Planctomycetia bacterium]
MVVEGQLRLGQLFANRRERGRAGLPIMSVTMNDGLVERSSLDRKTDSALRPEDHLLIKAGDIAYNMMRMWQGASGLASRDGLISPAYVVLRPLDAIDPLFASYWFKSARMVHLFWAYSYGLTSDRLRLYFKDFVTIPVVVPPISMQKRIAEMLRVWDQAQRLVKKRLDGSLARKRALMQRLIGSQLHEDFARSRNRVKVVEFGRIVQLRNDRYDPHDNGESLPCVELEHIVSEEGRLLGTCRSDQQDSLKNRFSPGNILFGKLRPYLAKYFFPTFAGVCSTEIWVLECDARVCEPKFLYYCVQTHSFIQRASVGAGSKMPRAEWDWVSEIPIVLPGIVDQRRIVEVLETCDREIAALNRHLDLLKEQKRGLMQKMLTGQDQVPTGKGGHR